MKRLLRRVLISKVVWRILRRPPMAEYRILYNREAGEPVLTIRPPSRGAF